MPKKRTFEKAKQDIINKFNYIKLLEFNGSNSLAKFLDVDFGEFEANFRAVYRGQSNHPNRAKLNKKNKTKQTNLEKYGVENVFQSEEIKDKIKQTNIKRYGVENPSQNEEIKDKKLKSSLQKFGTTCTLQNKEIQNKVKQTNLKRYGVESIFKSDEIKNKIKQTNLERHGVEYPQQNECIKNKKEQTNIKKYGVSCVTKNKEIYEKIKKTNLERYGFTRALCNKEIYKKSKNTNIKNGHWYNIDGYTLSEYYRNSELSDIRSYSTVQQQYKIDNNALNIDYYYEFLGKSRIADKWLSIIESELNYSLIREYHIPTTLYRSDGYDPKTNTVYEFYGDFWHGNLEKFAAEEMHPIKKKTYLELNNDTIERQKLILKLGYNIIYTWEKDFINNF